MQRIEPLALVGGWEHLGESSCDRWRDTWVQMHWAAQLVAKVAQTFLPGTADDSHPNMAWRPGRRLLAGRLITDEGGKFYTSLSPAEMKLSLWAAEGCLISSKRINGTTMDKAEHWLGHVIAEKTGGRLGPALSGSPYKMPDHAVAGGATFELAASASAEIGRWYGDAHLVLNAVRAWKNGSKVRCWPHHFDMATLLPIEDADGCKSVGVGLAPADGAFAEPYWYVTAWPYPKGSTDLPRLAGRGGWHREEWFGAVLLSSDTRAPTAEAEVRNLIQFLESAIEQIETLLNRS